MMTLPALSLVTIEGGALVEVMGVGAVREVMMTSWVDTSDEEVREPIRAGLTVALCVGVAATVVEALVVVLVVAPKSRASDGDISDGHGPEGMGNDPLMFPVLLQRLRSRTVVLLWMPLILLALPLPLSTALSKDACRENAPPMWLTELTRLWVLFGDERGIPSSSSSVTDSNGHPELKAALASSALVGKVLASVFKELSSVISESIVPVLTRSCSLSLLGSK